jgi:hypothetical protein
MNRKIITIISLQAILIITMFWVIVFYGKDEYEAYTREQEEEIENPSRVTTEHGATIVTLNAEARQQSDIQLGKARPAQQSARLPALGTVLAIDGLIELRTRYMASRADAQQTQASLQNTRQEYERLQQLNQDDQNVSIRAVMAAEALYKTDLAKLQAANTASRNAEDALRQQWGATLATEATKDRSALLDALLSYREVLIRITLPFDAPEPSAGSHLSLTPTGSSGQAVQASFVSIAPVSDAGLAGKTYFYRASASALRSGMRVSASLTTSQAHSGMLVPASAVVWYGGKPWVYTQTAPDKFKRLSIEGAAEAENGWFVAGVLQQDSVIVVSGVQLLLSEELRYQIKNENED